MYQLLGAIGVLALTTSVAGATGGFDCTIADQNLNFSVAAALSHGMGNAIIGYDATTDLIMEGVPKDLIKPNLVDSLVHHWVNYPDLRLHFYAETMGDAPFSSMELLIETTAIEGEEAVYEGEYWLAVYVAEDGRGIEGGGSVRCTGE